MEFYITGSVYGDSGLLSIIGRCGSQPMRPGVEFHALIREKPRSYPDGLESAREIEECRSVCIKVKEIEAYGRKVDVLPANSTGVLRCAEHSIDLVPGGWILTDQCVAANASTKK